MARNAVGFYWTLPVPWAGFTRLPNKIDEAAKLSRTIRYQRDLIRGYANDVGYRLVHEEVFLEIEPDRGSDLILGPLRKVTKICQDEDAILLFVDFWGSPKMACARGAESLATPSRCRDAGHCSA